ncbi:MAG: S-methyl-5'-thioinosine phosphorylase [Gammaproteobacteria bacterium]|nr:S-methyl-5'-thioinosine phosphorylase [Gammaproteobacteria bacterium]
MSGHGKLYAIIAGSGFSGLGENSAPQQVDTDYGKPSSPVRQLDFSGRPVLYLARHGDRLNIPPHQINYRANLKALHRLGADRVISLNTVGTVHREHSPGQLAIPEQLLDYTWGRDHSYQSAEAAQLEHIDFTEPFDREMRSALLCAATAAGVDCHDGGIYAATQGPRLETSAEVDRLERDGASYIGMTAMPEAALAAELGMRYACLSLIVNFAAGRSETAIHEDIEGSTLNAKMQAFRVLRVFFQMDSGD